MFLLPSRSRPHNVARLIRGFADTWADSPVLLLLDQDDPLLGAYRNLDLPSNWSITVGQPGPLNNLYNDSYQLHPDLDWYGFIADDVVPETSKWDRELIEAAGKDGLAFPDDSISNGLAAPHFVLGGDLVRSVGWLCLPGLWRIFIDTVWNDIARERGVFRYLPHVKLTHHHFSNRKALRDSTYRKPNNHVDKILYQTWKDTQ